jgi:hypothetical protein
MTTGGSQGWSRFARNDMMEVLLIVHGINGSTLVFVKLIEQ